MDTVHVCSPQESKTLYECSRRIKTMEMTFALHYTEAEANWYICL